MSKPRYLRVTDSYFMKIYDEYTREVRNIQVIDAKKPLVYWVDRRHIWGSSNKKDFCYTNHCVQENAVLGLDGIHAAFFHKTIAYIIFKNNIDVARRYCLEGDGKKIAEVNDIHGKKGLMQILKRDEPVMLKLLVPRTTRTIKYLKSEEMAAIREESKIRRSEKFESRSYTSPSQKGFRNGSRIWHAVPK